MSLADAALLAAITGFPRVSGDEPGTWAAKRVGVSFSPRERG